MHGWRGAGSGWEAKSHEDFRAVVISRGGVCGNRDKQGLDDDDGDDDNGGTGTVPNALLSFSGLVKVDF